MKIDKNPDTPKKSISQLIMEMDNDPEYQKRILARIEEWKPNSDNSCKNVDCKGEVVKRVSGANSEGYFFRIPACNVCRREYIGAVNARITGIAEFQKLMDTPYGL